MAARAKKHVFLAIFKKRGKNGGFLALAAIFLSSAPSPSEIPAAKPFWNLKTQQVQARNWRAGELVI